MTASDNFASDYFEEWTEHLLSCKRCYDASKLAIRAADRWAGSAWQTGSCDKGKALSLLVFKPR